MKTLRREPRLPAPEEKEKAAEAPAAWPAGWSFTPRELDAAEQLVLLSGSSTSTTGTAPSAAASGSSSASSSRSVNAPPPPAPPTPTPPPPPPPLPRPAAAESTVVVREERREHPEEDWEQRPGRRYRLIAEIYAVTEEIE
uniref:Uncharacterized protein n=1 Tax=Oryza meridionalis TaxID=40149 RepID=A0A0E0EUF7_9ORYZ